MNSLLVAANFGSAAAFTVAALLGLVAVARLFEGGIYVFCFALLLIVAAAGLAVPVESDVYYTVRQVALRSVSIALCYLIYVAAREARGAGARERQSVHGRSRSPQRGD